MLHGDSALKICIPPIPSKGNIAIAKTIIPMPPTQSDFVPSKIDDVERTIKEIGLTEFRPVKSLPLKD